MRFSQRIGITPVSKAIQLEFIDKELQNSLWNAFRKEVLGRLDTRVSHLHDSSQFDDFAEVLWDNLFKLPTDSIPSSSDSTVKQLRTWFFDWTWHQIYDFIEFLASENVDDFHDPLSYTVSINTVLEREVSGYRFVGRLLAPITNQTELSAIQEAIDQTTTFTSIQGANIHLSTALEMLSNRQTPDYRNSIKESLSAVEATVRFITKESTLGDGLRKLNDKGIKIDSQLKAGFEKHYAYSNNKSSGIRHSIIEEHQSPDFDDAKYMLVTCCAFINFLVGKCRSNDINLQ